MKPESMFYINYRPDPGSVLEESAIMAVKIAENNKKPVILNFNEAAIVVKSTSLVDDITAEYRNQRQAKLNEYRSSDEGTAEKKRYEGKSEQLIATVNALVDALPATLDRGLTDTIKWVQEYSVSACHSDTNAQAPEVIAAFSRAGFEPNANTGTKFSEQSPDVFGRYVVGQLLNGLIADGRPHPIAKSFCDAYLKIVNHESAGAPSNTQKVTTARPCNP